MSRLTTHERVCRLERCFLSFVAMITGEAQAVTSPEELLEIQKLMGEEMKAMTADLNT